MGWIFAIAVLLLLGTGVAVADSSSPVESSNQFEDSGSGTLQQDPVTFSDGILDSNQIGQLAAAAGFSGRDLNVAVAVALAESVPSGNPNSYNPETQAGTPQGQGSYGLWQIYLKVHPEFSGWNLFDPMQNARAAFSVYSAAGNSFRPWSTFNSGKYAAFLNS